MEVQRISVGGRKLRFLKTLTSLLRFRRHAPPFSIRLEWKKSKNGYKGLRFQTKRTSMDGRKRCEKASVNENFYCVSEKQRKFSKTY